MLGQKEVHFGKGQWKRVELEEVQDGVEGCHGYVEQQQDVLPVVEV